MLFDLLDAPHQHTSISSGDITAHIEVETSVMPPVSMIMRLLEGEPSGVDHRPEEE